MKRVHGGSNAIAISASSIEAAARRMMNNIPAPDLFSKIDNHGDRSSKPCIRVNGPIVVGAGPSGLATGACLKEQGVPFIVIEKADCLGSLWKKRTYDRLMLHLPKQFCQLPELAFPEELPDYPTKDQFIEYLELYAKTFEINPQFNECVQAARFDQKSELWKVTTNQAEYICRWLVVATGENAESFIPAIDGLGQFKGDLIHASEYKSGENFRGKRVLVIGCGMSGREISLDLSNHHSSPSMVCRRLVAPGFLREMLGKSRSELDVMNLMMSWSIEGELRALDFDVFEKIRSGGIKVVPGIKAINDHEVEFVNGEKLVIDAVVLATGYRSNVSSWLQERDLFLENGYPKVPFPRGWKGNAGLYAAGFTMRGLYGASHDAMEIANDISQVWKQEPKQKKQRITA